MEAERKEKTNYHGDTPIQKEAASKITDIQDEEIEAICKGLEPLKCSRSERRTLAAGILKTLNVIRAKELNDGK